MIKPYLMFNRECKEAFNLYQKAFDGEMIAIQKYGDMPPNPEFPVVESDKALVLHAELKLTESGYIMGSDGKKDFQDAEKVCISVELDSEERAKNAWNVLQEGATIHMDLHNQHSFLSFMVLRRTNMELLGCLQLCRYS